MARTAAAARMIFFISDTPEFSQTSGGGQARHPLRN
jgi:hypothetical protein